MARIRSIEGSGEGHLIAVVLTATSESATVDSLAGSVRRRSGRIQICSAFATAGRARVSPWSRELFRPPPRAADPVSRSQYHSTDQRSRSLRPRVASHRPRYHSTDRRSRSLRPRVASGLLRPWTSWRSRAGWCHRQTGWSNFAVRKHA